MFDKMRQMFDSSDWHGQDIVDVTGNEAVPIAVPKNRPDTVITEKTWLQKLGPSFYWHNHYDPPQVIEETERLFIKLADYIDAVLKRQGKSLGAGDYLLSSIYSLAHSYISAHYQGRREDYENYWLQNIGQQTSMEIENKVRLLCKLYLEKLPPPTSQTLARYNLTPNGLPNYWWDRTGQVRERKLVNKKYFETLSRSPSRNTIFWAIDPEINAQILNRYLKALDFLTDSLDNSDYHWSTRQRRVLENLADKKQTWIYREELRLPLAILKLSEQAVRAEVKYASVLNVEEAKISVERLVPRTLREPLLQIISTPLNPSLSNVALNNLRQAFPRAWKVDAQRATSSTAPGLFNYYRNQEQLEKFCNEVLKLYNEPGLRMLAIYYLRTLGPLKPAKQKILEKYVHPRQLKAFEKLVKENEKPSKQLVKKILSLNKAPRREVTLNLEKVQRVQKKHDQTVVRLNEFLGEEAAALDSGEVKPVIKKESIADIFRQTKEEIILDETERELILMLLENDRKTTLAEGKKFAAQKKRMLGGLVQSLNQKVYSELSDQLINQVDDIIELDTNYLEFAKRIVE